MFFVFQFSSFIIYPKWLSLILLEHPTNPNYFFLFSSFPSQLYLRLKGFSFFYLGPPEFSIPYLHYVNPLFVIFRPITNSVTGFLESSVQSIPVVLNSICTFQRDIAKWWLSWLLNFIRFPWQHKLPLIVLTSLALNSKLDPRFPITVLQCSILLWVAL